MPAVKQVTSVLMYAGTVDNIAKAAQGSWDEEQNRFTIADRDLDPNGDTLNQRLQSHLYGGNRFRINGNVGSSVAGNFNLENMSFATRQGNDWIFKRA